MQLHRSVLALFAVLLTNIVYASDWQYAGSVKDGAHQFFDAETLTHPTRDVVRVWVKSIQERRFNRYLQNHEKLIVEKTAHKIASGYSPRFLELPAIMSRHEGAALKDVAVEITAYEVMANRPDIQMFSKFYFEIDCANKRIKLLDGTLYKDNGNISNRKARPDNDYTFIMPDSNGQWLSLLACSHN